MSNPQAFKSYASKHLGLNAHYLEQYIAQSTKGAQATISPTVIEERNMNIAQLDVFSRLMMDRIIFLGTAINDYVANVVQAQLLFLHSVDPRRDIQMYINSPGGSVTAGLGIYDTMQYVGPDIATICTSMAASMGAVLLTAGAEGKRSALPHSRIMIHQASGGMQGQVADMEISYKFITELQKDLQMILSKHSGQSYETIHADSDRDKWMTAKDALDYGLIDEVLE